MNQRPPIPLEKLTSKNGKTSRHWVKAQLMRNRAQLKLEDRERDRAVSLWAMIVCGLATAAILAYVNWP
jgi:hypothetical protein